MGRDFVDFVTGASVSRHLICSICQQVLERPVQTKCEHLFCEDELIEWLMHKQSCPVCNAEINSEEVARAPRAIVGLLDDLVCYCDYRGRGCDWTGPSDALAAHARACARAPRDALVAALAREVRDHERCRRSLADRDREVDRLRVEVERLSKALASTEEAHERELHALETGPRHASVRGSSESRSTFSCRRGHDRGPVQRTPADRTDVARTNSLRDSLETLRLHPADRDPRRR